LYLVVSTWVGSSLTDANAKESKKKITKKRSNSMKKYNTNDSMMRLSTGKHISGEKKPRYFIYWYTGEKKRSSIKHIQTLLLS